jgi:two-component system, LytTR family, response regulator LytT
VTTRMSTPAAGLRVLVADDETPAREELAWLLGHDPAVGTVHTAASGTEVLRKLETLEVDALFLDIRMPGLDGLDVARVLARFQAPPKVVFVTAYDEHAVEAFDLRAVDYLLKPVRAERLAEAVRRVSDALGAPAEPAADDIDETIAVELGGVTRFVQRSDVRFVEAHGDYARLHTAGGSHLVRVPLATLEQQWAAAGFVRIHRSHLVSLQHIDEMRVDSGRWTVRLGADVLQVSRRHSRDLRDMLVRRARPGPEL